MKKSFAINLAAACSILIWASSLAVGQCTVSSSAFQPEGLPRGFDSTALTIESIQLPFPAFIEVADSNEVYVFGGQPLVLDIYANAILTGQLSQPNPLYYSQFTPYVVQVDPVTMDTMFRELLGGPGIPYLGGTAKHPNGYLYAIARARAHLILPYERSPDPGTFYLLETTAPDRVTNLREAAPASFTLYPNPAQEQLFLRYALEASAEVRVSVHDLTGRELRELQPMRPVAAGEHEVRFSVKDLPAGVYLMQVAWGGQSKWQKWIKE